MAANGPEQTWRIRGIPKYALNNGLIGLAAARRPSAEDALELLKENKVDLVFSDIVMPGMSGMEMAHQIEATHGSMPVLLASGYSSKQFVPVSERKFPILRKPCTRESVARGIRQLIEREET